MTAAETQVTTDQSDPTGGLRDFETPLALREVQAIGKPYRYLEGRAVPYLTWANIGMFMERHLAGSLKRSTETGVGRKLPLLLFHDHRSFPVGVSDQWAHGDDGLDGVWKLNDTAEAQRAARAAEAGELTGLSIGFQPIRSSWEFVDWDDWDPDLGPDHMDKVSREESRLVEVSITPTPAFADAQVNAVRSSSGGRPERSPWSHDQQLALRASHLGQRPHPEADRWRAIVEDLKSR